MCSQTEIARRTLVQTASLHGLDPTMFLPTHELKGDLGYDDYGLVYLAGGLRLHIRWCNGLGSIYTPELRKAKFNIRKLVQLMILRTLGAELSDGHADQRIIAAKESMA